MPSRKWKGVKIEIVEHTFKMNIFFDSGPEFKTLKTFFQMMLHIKKTILNQPTFFKDSYFQINVRLKFFIKINSKSRFIIKK